MQKLVDSYTRAFVASKAAAGGLNRRGAEVDVSRRSAESQKDKPGDSLISRVPPRLELGARF